MSARNVGTPIRGVRQHSFRHYPQSWQENPGKENLANILAGIPANIPREVES